MMQCVHVGHITVDTRNTAPLQFGINHRIKIDYENLIKQVMPSVCITFKFKLMNYSARIAEEAKQDSRLRRIDCFAAFVAFPRILQTPRPASDGLAAAKDT